MIKYRVTISNGYTEFLSLEEAEIYAAANDGEISELPYEAYNLAALKANKIKEIDNKTQEIIASGFEFDNERFSLSSNAQINWMGIKALSSLLSFPVEVTTKEDGVYTLAEANVDAFVGTAVTIVKIALDSGRALKVAAQAATNLEELEEVLDNR